MLSNMQFTAMMVMVLLTMVLAVLPQRVARNHVADHSRWLMAAATGLLALQFALQYKLKLRSMGVTQAVTLNLPFFIIASMLLSIALLYLQRQGRIQRQEWMVGVATWVVTVALIAGAVLSDGQPLMSDTKELRMAETTGGIFYALMQFYYSLKNLRQLGRLRKNVAAYYDREMRGILNWMERSVWLLTVIAILVPLMIFTNGKLLRLFSFLSFMALFYLVICFLCYMVSNDQHLVEVAEDCGTGSPTPGPSRGEGSIYISNGPTTQISSTQISSPQLSTENVTSSPQSYSSQPSTENVTSSPQPYSSQPSTEDVTTPLPTGGAGGGASEASWSYIISAVAQWTAQGGHLRQELNIQTVADEMHVQRSQLSAWLKTTEWEVFATWLTYLRIEEAKRMLKEHPDWSNDYVAQHCGFSSRTYFQKKFKEIAGVPPGEFAGESANEFAGESVCT